MDSRLHRRERLAKKQDLEHVLFRGRQSRAGPVWLYWAPAHDHYRRVAFITSGKFPNNVIRNRVKRRLRECFRMNKELFSTDAHYILRGTAEVAGMAPAAIRDTVIRLIRITTDQRSSEANP